MFVYILVCTKFMGPRDEMRSMLRGIDVIDEVIPLFDNSFLISSEASANRIASEIRHYHPTKRFLISRISNNRQGWLPRNIWNFIREDED